MEGFANGGQTGVYYGQQAGYIQQPGYGMATEYGAAAYDDKQMSMAGPGAKGMFARGRRQRINMRPLFLCTLVPWALFAVVYAALSFSIHFETPTLCAVIVMGALVLTAVAGFLAFSPSGRWFANAEHEPTWLIFFFISMLIAFVSAYVLGSMNYSQNMQKYYTMADLNNYTDINPAKAQGASVMDAGIIQFTDGAKLDITKSMGFMNTDIYCVAPISMGDATLANYDFWAVGKDCCSSTKADYHCENYAASSGTGGLRLMSDSDRAFYRLAVQQAEATYGIKAMHPLFFLWTIEPSAAVETWKQTGRSEYIVWMLSYAVFQAFLVAVAALFFAKRVFTS